MYCLIYSASLIGFTSIKIHVEVSATTGLPQETIIGLPDTVIKESKPRIKSALRLAGFDLPAMAYTINLAPIDISKKSPCVELAIAVGLLVITKQVILKETYCFIGSLSLNGSIEPVRLILPMIHLYEETTIFVIPKKNVTDISHLCGIQYKVVETLQDLSLLHDQPVKTVSYSKLPPTSSKQRLNFDSIVGHYLAKLACVFSISGQLPLLFIGPPGIGKTLLINHLQCIQPPLNRTEAIENYCIQSLIDTDPYYSNQPPFQNPHHTITYPGMIGGQNPPKPGEISLANHGILFLDELGEYQRHILDTLREPLESAQIKISRAGNTTIFPAKFLLIAAMNPCHCGHYDSPDVICKCRPNQLKRYWERLSKPLLDRFGICLILSQPKHNDTYISHNEMENMIRNAKEAAIKRNPNGCSNQMISHDILFEIAQFEKNARHLLDQFCNQTSYRARHRLTKLSLTIADCYSATIIKRSHVALAIQLSQHSKLP